jgi:DNA-binding transcriptional LysR family regulator
MKGGIRAVELSAGKAPHVDLNLLVALDALLQERNVTRAGRRVGLSQPAMSAALSRLRRIFGDELLVRVKREYHLSPLGRELAEPLRTLVTQMEQMLEKRAAFDPATERRAFTIGASDYATWMLLHPLLQELNAKAPNVSLHVYPLQPDLASMLEPGGVDVLILPMRDLVTGCPFEPLFPEEWVCAVSETNTEVGDELTKEVFQALPHLGYVIGNQAVPSLAERHLDELGVERSVEVTVESFIVAPFMVRGTRYITTLPERLVRRLASVAGVRVLASPYDIPGFVEAAYWNHINTSDPGHWWFRKILREVAARVAASPT